jgi:hypothetical protein
MRNTGPIRFETINGDWGSLRKPRPQQDPAPLVAVFYAPGNHYGRLELIGLLNREDSPSQKGDFGCTRRTIHRRPIGAATAFRPHVAKQHQNQAQPILHLDPLYRSVPPRRGNSLAWCGEFANRSHHSGETIRSPQGLTTGLWGTRNLSGSAECSDC